MKQQRMNEFTKSFADVIPMTDVSIDCLAFRVTACLLAFPALLALDFESFRLSSRVLGATDIHHLLKLFQPRIIIGLGVAASST